MLFALFAVPDMPILILGALIGEPDIMYGLRNANILKVLIMGSIFIKVLLYISWESYFTFMQAQTLF